MKETYWQRSSNAHFIEKNPVLCQVYWVPWSCSTSRHFKRSVLALVSVKKKKPIRWFSLSWAQGWIALPRSSWLDDAILANELSAGGEGISLGLRQLIAGWDSPSSASPSSDAVEACVEIKFLSVWVPENAPPTQIEHIVENLGICAFCYLHSIQLAIRSLTILVSAEEWVGESEKKEWSMGRRPHLQQWGDLSLVQGTR